MKVNFNGQGSLQIVIRKLSDQVWYGDESGPSEAGGEVKSILAVGHNLSAEYWAAMHSVHSSTWYARLALPDDQPATEAYLAALVGFVDHARDAGKLPLLCHCRYGGHRGPTAAIFAYWHLAGRTRAALQQAREIVYANGHCGPRYNRVYHPTTMAYCEAHSDLGSSKELSA